MKLGAPTPIRQPLENRGMRVEHEHVVGVFVAPLNRFQFDDFVLRRGAGFHLRDDGDDSVFGRLRLRVGGRGRRRVADENVAVGRNADAVAVRQSDARHDLIRCGRTARVGRGRNALAAPHRRRGKVRRLRHAMSRRKLPGKRFPLSRLLAPRGFFARQEDIGLQNRREINHDVDRDQRVSANRRALFGTNDIERQKHGRTPVAGDESARRSQHNGSDGNGQSASTRDATRLLATREKFCRVALARLRELLSKPSANHNDVPLSTLRGDAPREYSHF